MKCLVTTALALALGCASGCAAGNYRTISFSSDMTPGDLAHYREKAAASEKEPLERFIGGIPFLFLPLILTSQECIADRIASNEFHYHFEDSLLFLILVAGRATTANFDQDGRNLSYNSRRSVLGGLLSSETGHRLLKDNTYGPTGSFSLIWGLFGTERTITGRSWRIFWIPIV